MEKETFKELSDKLLDAVGGIRSALKKFEDEAESAEKKAAEAETRKRYAEQGYEDAINRSSAYLREFEEKKKEKQKELDILIRETVYNHTQSENDRTEAKKSRDQAEKKEEQLSIKLAEVEAIKVELEMKKQRARELVQAI